MLIVDFVFAESSVPSATSSEKSMVLTLNTSYPITCWRRFTSFGVRGFAVSSGTLSWTFAP